jgi:hypothetical protein
MRAVKSALAFLLLAAFSLSACNNLVTRRELYSPAKGTGPYSEAIYTGTWREGRYPQPKKETKPASSTGTEITEPAPLR